MRKKVLLIILSLVLILTSLMPATVVAAKPSVSVVATGGFSLITDGVVFPAGNSGRFVVAERVITGFFDPGPFEGEFTLTYHANVVLENQAGTFQGRLVMADGSVLNVDGISQPITFPPELGGAPNLNISGRWTVISGPEKGNGNFTANLGFFPIGEHIFSVIPGWSRVELTGKLGN